MYTLLLIIGVLFNIFLGVIALMRYRDGAARALFFVSLGLILWEVANYLSDDSGTSALLWNRLTFAGPPLIMFASYYFVGALRGKPINRWACLFLSIGTIISVAVSTMTPLVVDSVTVRGGDFSGTDPVYGPLYLLYLAWVALLIALFLVRTFASTSSESWRKSQQLRVIRIGSIVSIGLPIITNVVLSFTLKTSAFSQLVPVTSIIYISALSIAIFKHGLLDIRLAVARSVAYVFVLAALSIIYYIIAYLLSMFLMDSSSAEGIANVTSPLSMLIGVALAFVFQPIKQFFDKVTDDVFFHESYNVNVFLSTFNSILSRSSDLRDLGRRSSDHIAKTLRAQKVFVLVRYGDNNGEIISEGYPKKANLPLADIEYLDEYLEHNPLEMIARNRLERDSALYKMFVSHGLEMVMPLYRQDKPIGYIGVGERQSGDYSPRDYEALRLVPDELALAVENAISVQEVKDLNDNLQQRIDSATRELRRSNQQLQRLDEAKDEFVSMASHQLRTPLTSIKGYVSMLLDGDVGKMTPQQKHVLKEVYLSSERMVRLIGDFLNVSRLQTGKFTLEKKPTDLSDLVKKEIESLESHAKAKGVTFEYKKPTHIPLVNIDAEKIQQVVMNFTDNAIFYSKDRSKVRIILKKVNNYVELEIMDSGIGVPEKEQNSLFNKFFRASNARKQRPDGTGVGLFLAKKVVQAHDGEIIFSSEEGRGSTFGFRLPIE